MEVCTIVARNYLAQARVLATSYSRHHEGRRLKVLVIDADAVGYDGVGEPFDLVRPAQLPIEGDEFELMATIYSALELATAVKPALLRHLLESGASSVVYLDPDIEVFGALDELDELANAHGIVLVPHLLAPIPDDGCGPAAADIAQAGVYNLGFIAVGSGSRDFLEWWGERLRRDCVVAPEEGLFVDQRLIDFVPGFYPHMVLRDPGYDVAYWNLHERDVVVDGERVTVDGAPLRFFHFSGFDPRKPHLLSKHQGPVPRILLSERPGVAELCASYAHGLLDADYEALIDLDYGYGRTSDGVPVDHRMRWLYREALLTYERGEGPVPPNPFGEQDAFLDWCNEPFNQAAPEISRYVFVAWDERADLHAAFPDVLGADRDAFLAWMQFPESTFNPPIPHRLLPSSVAAARHDALSTLRGFAEPSATRELAARHGVNVAGYLHAESGVGEAARLLISGLRAAGLDYGVISYKRTVNRQENPFSDDGTGAPEYSTNIICVNADQLPNFAREMGQDFFAGRHSIGLWFWEVEEFPEEMRPAAAYLDEIWVASRHAASAIAPVVDKPVLVAPLPIVAPDPVHLTREELALPEGFLFLFAFDFNSIPERKNPYGLVEAFTRAFSHGEGPTLVLKTVNGRRNADAFEKLIALTAARDDVIVVDGYFDVQRQHALVAQCDAYVSLHRSEGFGLTMAEAMALGKPVIATAYSGNLEFMSGWNSYLVPYELTEIPAGCDPYPAGARWAEPDLDAAAAAMRWVYEHPEEAAERGRAAATVVSHHGPEELARFLERRLGEIERRRVAPELSTAPVPPIPEVPGGNGFHGPQRTRAFRAARNTWWLLPRPLRDALRPLIFKRSGVSVSDGPVPSANGAGVATAEREATGVALADLQERSAALTQAQLALLDRLEEVETRHIQGEQLEVRLRELEKSVELARGAVAGLRTDVAVAGKEVSRAARASRAGLDATGRRLETLEGVVAAAAERMDVVERSLRDDVASALAAATSDDVARGLDEIKRALAARPYMAEPAALSAVSPDGGARLGYVDAAAAPADGDLYREFENVFRGPESLVRERDCFYLKHLVGPLADLGCGRGELLDLAFGEGIEAVGVDIDAGMVAHCREKGHDVEEADALEWLERQPDSSLGTIFSAQVVEHFDHRPILRLFELARLKLREDGVLIVETVNPHAPAALKAFWVDPTHKRPLFPEALLVLARLSGFEQGEIVFPNGGGVLEDDLWRAGEYALVARPKAL